MTHHRAKLTAWIVREIRRRHDFGESQSALAKEYGVSQPTIAQIVHQATWKDVRDTEGGYKVFDRARNK